MVQWRVEKAGRIHTYNTGSKTENAKFYDAEVEFEELLPLNFFLCVLAISGCREDRGIWPLLQMVLCPSKNKRFINMEEKKTKFHGW